MFVPRVFDGVSWVRVAPPQREPGAACLAVAAHLRAAAPAMPGRELDARVACVVRLFEDGITGVVMIGEGHRVDRIDLLPVPAGESRSRPGGRLPGRARRR